VKTRFWPGASLLMAGALTLTMVTGCADRSETIRSTTPGAAWVAPATASVRHGPSNAAVADTATVEAAVEAADRALTRAEEAMAGDD